MVCRGDAFFHYSFGNDLSRALARSTATLCSADRKTNRPAKQESFSTTTPCIYQGNHTVVTLEKAWRRVPASNLLPVASWLGVKVRGGRSK